MSNQKFIGYSNRFLLVSLACLILPATVQASFIESSIGTAVVNDATAAYYNPAALILLKNSQIIPLASVAYFRTQFTGQSTTVATSVTETGRSTSNTHYYSPSLYLGMPATDRIVVGVAMVSNAANRSADENSVLRYVQASNSIQDFDLVPAIGIKINDMISIGAGINFSYADFQLKPVSGFPGSNTTDSESNNESNGSGIGADVGILIKPSPATLIGVNYRSATTYRLSGKSVFNGSQQVVSDNYHFKLWTPARSVLSINHFVTSSLGFISTIQRIQWSILKNINVYGIANMSGTDPVIVNATVPYYLHDTWLLTLGSHYRVTPKWIVRVAGTYNQSPANPSYQIATGDSIILGVSMGYELNKTITIDGSYAHVFIKDENINFNGSRYLISGVNEGSRDAVSLKVTFDV